MRNVRILIAALAAALAFSSPALAQWPTSCVTLNDIVEADRGKHDNVGKYQRVFGADAEAACQADLRDHVRTLFAWAFADAPGDTSGRTPWPATCVALNDIVEAHLGSHANVGMYQRVFRAGAEAACQRDHRAEVRVPFAWAFDSYSVSPIDRGVSITAERVSGALSLVANWESPRNFLRWSPDGSKVLLSVGPQVLHVQSDGSQYQHLVDTDTGMRRVAGPAYENWGLHAIDISPDGEYLAYSTFEHPDRPPGPSLPEASDYEIGLLKIDGSNRRPLTMNGSYDDFPSWSPDGSRVAYVQWDYDAGYGISVVGVHSSEANVVVPGWVLPNTATHRQAPAWSPDGKNLAFVGMERDRGLGQAIYTVGVDGSNLRMLTETVTRPAWSPDGKRIAFAKPDGDELALYTIGADGSDLRRLTTVELSNHRLREITVNVERDEPGSWGATRGGGWLAPSYGLMSPKSIWLETVAWSPDGSMILYNCGALLCIVTADGNHLGATPFALNGDLIAAWSPNGSRVAVGKLRLSSQSPNDGIALFTMLPDGSDIRLLLLHNSEGDLRLWGERPTVRHVQTDGCIDGRAVPDPSDNSGLVRDCETLLSVRDGLQASPPLDWSDDRPISDWEGVAVGGKPLRVQGLNLRYRAMTGVIPRELATLTQLRTLDLSWNMLSGYIPPELEDLRQLTSLDFFANYLTGVIPPELAKLSELTRLSLSNNFLHGSIPSELAALSKLESLNLSDSLLTGTIPPEFAHLRRLQYLDLGNNQLTGSIPPDFGYLTGLHTLVLNHNSLSGQIPGSLGQLVGLDTLKLHQNKLTGPIPPELGSLRGARELSLNHNKLTGRIPIEFGRLDDLLYLHLNNNRLTGSIPAELGSSVSLSYLYLNDNDLSGPIPPELGRLKDLDDLDASGNRLSGTIPAELGGLVSLLTLDLADNKLSGTIPAELGSLQNLRSLHIGNNQLTGQLPQELGHLFRLSSLRLQGNSLTGAIPQSFGGLIELDHLSLAGNQLTGEIPRTLGALRYLRELDLSENMLTGQILPELAHYDLEYLNLSQNYLSGSIPSSLGQPYRLETLDLSNNRLSGYVPPELGTSSSLRMLRLGDNQLTGDVPKSLRRLVRLEELGFSGNDLGGCMPNNLRFVLIEERERLRLSYCQDDG